MCAKMGRPTENPKDVYINVRVTKDDKQLLLECCKLMESSQYDVVMKGIRQVYQDIKK